MTLNEIELKLCLLKKRTRKAIERNEATISRLQRTNQDRDNFIAALEGRPPPILEEDSLFNSSLGSSSTEHSDPEPQVIDSDESSSELLEEEYRDDANSSSSIGNERHGVEHDSSSSLSSFESSDSTTASSTASRVQAFLQMAATEERRILARLDCLRRAGSLSLQRSDDAVAATNQNQESRSTDTE